jgi:hypothetical protein
LKQQNDIVIALSTPAPDAILGVNLYGDIAPDDFGSYDRAFVTVFTMTAGNSWVSQTTFLQPFQREAAINVVDTSK